MVITNHLFGLAQCYSEVGDCRIEDYSFNIMFMLPLELGLILLALLLTMIIFLKLGRPSNWFKSYPADESQHFDSFDTGEAR